MYADLHIHTTFSDGTDTPKEIIELAIKEGIQTIAITDHDSVEGVKSIINMPSMLNIIPAIEVSTVTNNKYIHILGFYIDVFSEKLSAFIKEISSDKTNNTRVNFENAKAVNSFSYDWSRVLKLNPNQPRISGVHVVKAMKHDNYKIEYMSLWDMFSKYYRAESPDFIETEKFTAYDAIDIIKTAGGIPIIAHPVTVGDDYSDKKMLKFCGIGVAVENAIDEVKQAADYVCKSNDKDGVAAFIEEHIL